MTATHSNVTAPQGVLYLAFELGWTEWKLAFTTGQGQAPRLRTLKARDLPGLQEEVAKAKQRFGLPADAPIQLLRSGPRRLLAASLSDRRRPPEPDCGFGQH